MSNFVEKMVLSNFIWKKNSHTIYKRKSGIRKILLRDLQLIVSIQGGAADMIKKAMNKIDTFIYENKLETKC